MNFAKFQNTDLDSKYYGRIPNRAQPTGIIYNTTDGTPRFVMEIMDYLRYSGDTAIISEIFPIIKRSIEGSLKFWVDDKGYLTHEDADTWMDAKREDGHPYSPRGNRANDIQSLWYQQLMASAWMAAFIGEGELELQWMELAEKVKKNFNSDFFSENEDYIADRLFPDGACDFKLRPNQLYAFELVDDDFKKATIAKKVWENLAYPWGVASLSQYNADFHPYHENWAFYHKDEAYHNGTVWLWNNGMAMQRLLEVGQTELAYALFKNINKQALQEGAVGSLAENSDALPLPGAQKIRLTGAFLQAWSNAEHLRIWYQYFLGFRPDLVNNVIHLEPKLPEEVTFINTKIYAGDFTVDFSFERSSASVAFSYQFANYEGKAIFYIDCFTPQELMLKEGFKVSFLRQKKQEKQLKVAVWDENGMEKNFTIGHDQKEKDRQNELDVLFKDVGFIQPYLMPDLASLKKT